MRLLACTCSRLPPDACLQMLASTCGCSTPAVCHWSSLTLVWPCSGFLGRVGFNISATRLLNSRRRRCFPSPRVSCRACEQIRSSSRLRRVLAVVLAAGNQLNAGTARGGAGGCLWLWPACWHPCLPACRACLQRCCYSLGVLARRLLLLCAAISWLDSSSLSSYLPTYTKHSAGGVKLDSLLKLNDVKVTATPATLTAAASAAAAATPHRSASDEQQLPPAAALAVAANGQATQANGTAAGAGEAAAVALPPVKTLLEFVVWVVLHQEASEAAPTSSGGPGGASGAAKPGGGNARSGSGGSGGSGLGDEALARAVKGGYLAGQLSELALAVRRMQTGELAAELAMAQSGAEGAVVFIRPLCLHRVLTSGCWHPAFPRTFPSSLHQPHYTMQMWPTL